jgi:hypothetical protein
MSSHRLLALVALLSWALSLGVAHAARFGSTLEATPNTFWGCEQAPIFDPITGVPTLAPTFQTTCTLRNVGYINSLQVASIVPSNGVITRIAVKSGPNPAPLQLTILQGSPGLCCTARRFGPVFQPRPNAITVQRVRIRVRRSLFQNAQQVSDFVALTAVGPGTLPLSDQGTAGTFTSGSALLQQWYPLTAIGDVRNGDPTTVDGLELLLQWTFQPARRKLN